MAAVSLTRIQPALWSSILMSLSRRRFVAASAAFAANTTLLSRLAFAAPAKEDWITLFDGKTLKGWHKNPEKIGHGTGGLWQGDDGAIAREPDPPRSSNDGLPPIAPKIGQFSVPIV